MSKKEKFNIKKIVNAFCVKECPEQKNENNATIILDCKPTKGNQKCEVSNVNYYQSKKLLGRFCFPSKSDKEAFDEKTQRKILVYDYSKKKNIERIVSKTDIRDIDNGQYVKIDSLIEKNDYNEYFNKSIEEIFYKITGFEIKETYSLFSNIEVKEVKFILLLIANTNNLENISLTLFIS